MLEDRGIEVDHTTLYRRVQHCEPLTEKYLCWYWRCPTISSRRVVNYLSNRLESNLGTLKRLVKPTLGFKSLMI